jgi:hypothetical protein
MVAMNLVILFLAQYFDCVFTWTFSTTTPVTGLHVLSPAVS